MWGGCLVGTFLCWAGSTALGIATVLLRLVVTLPGALGTGLLAAGGLALAVLAGWFWLEGQLRSLERAWLLEARQ